MVKVVAADPKNQKESQRVIKRIKYFICNTVPQFDSNPTKNFAFSQHKNEDHCKIH